MLFLALQKAGFSHHEILEMMDDDVEEYIEIITESISGT